MLYIFVFKNRIYVNEWNQTQRNLSSENYFTGINANNYQCLSINGSRLYSKNLENS